MHIALLAVLVCGGLAAADIPASKQILMPPGTKATGSYAAADGQGFENLLDGKDSTVCSGAPGTGNGQVLHIRFNFPQGVARVTGIALGASDPYHNYFPHEIEVVADTGTGKFDTVLGTISGLGPGRKSEGRFPLSRPVNVKRLELRLTKYEQGKGVKRAPQLSDVWLLVAR